MDPVINQQFSAGDLPLNYAPSVPNQTEIVSPPRRRIRLPLKKIFLTLVLLVLVGLGTYVGLRSVQNSTENRSKASGGLSVISLSPSVTELHRGQQVVVRARLNTNGDNVSMVDLNVQFDPQVFYIYENNVRDNSAIMPFPKIINVAQDCAVTYQDPPFAVRKVTAGLVHAIVGSKMVEDNCSVNFVPFNGDDAIATLSLIVKSNAPYGNSTIQIGEATKVAAIGNNTNALESSLPTTIAITEQIVDSATFNFSTKIQGISQQIESGDISESVNKVVELTFESLDGLTKKSYSTTVAASTQSLGVFAPATPVVLDALPLDSDYYVYVKEEHSLRGLFNASGATSLTPIHIVTGENSVSADWPIPELLVGDLINGEEGGQKNKINFQDIVLMVNVFKDPPIQTGDADFQDMFDLRVDGQINFYDVMMLVNNYTVSPRCGVLLQGEVCAD